MTRILLTISILWLVTPVWAAGGDNEFIEHSGANVENLASLQRGAATFANYCNSCHSAQYMRYQRLTQDLELTEEQVDQFLIFGERDLTDYMKAAMPAESKDWFGVQPPDLTLTARSRGGDWIYSFLKSFYMTGEGWNNAVLENASMPHVLWELQGIQRPILETWTDESGEEHTRIAQFELDQPGKLNAQEYDRTIRDLTAFMIYLAEPAVLERESLGIWVILFLVVFTFLAYLLYKDYWQDVRK